MGFVKRLTGERKLVSSECPNLGDTRYSTEQLGKYFKTLDIEVLGKVPDLLALHTIFTVEPLKVKDEGFIGMGYINHWEVFRRRVKAIENFKDSSGNEIAWEREGDNRMLTDAMRELIPVCVVEDIAGMIVSLANNDGLGKPHTIRATFTADLRTWRMHLVNVKEETARMADVTDNA